MPTGQNMGASTVAETGSRASMEPASSLHPTGFDPARGLHILQHSLGVDRFGQGKQYRNHFVTGEGSTDYPDCCALVSAGLMTKQKSGPLTGGDDAFFVTEAGKAYVAEHSPPPPKLSKSQQRYREWLKVSDATGETFIEFCRRQALAAGAQRAETNEDLAQSEGRQSGAAKQRNAQGTQP